MSRILRQAAEDDELMDVGNKAIKKGDNLLAEVDEYASGLGVDRVKAVHLLIKVAIIDFLVGRQEQHRLEKVVHESKLQ